MSDLTDQLKTDLINLTAHDIPKNCTIMSITSTALVEQLEQSETVEFGGEIVEITSKVHAIVSVFTTPPVIGQTCTIDGVTKRIGPWIKSLDDNEYIISLVNPDN